MKLAMKILRTFFAIALAFMGNVAMSQPPRTLVQVLVVPDHQDWTYHVGEEVRFSVQVLRQGALLKDVSVDYEMGPEWFPEESRQGLVLRGGTLTLKSKMSAPGFLRCKVKANVEGRSYEGLATVGIDPEKIEPTVKEPEDFDAFWADALYAARLMPLEPKMELLPEQCTSTQNVYHISFQNERRGSRIYGILTVPKKPGKYPALLEVPGAGVYKYGPDTSYENTITLCIGIHGIPVNLPGDIYKDLANGPLCGYNAYSTNDPHKYYYRRVFVGCAKAVDFIYSLPEFDGKTVGVKGGSQGGTLSLVTAALEPRISFVAAGFPGLADMTGFLHGRVGGWPYFFSKGKRQPLEGEVETLAYFDLVNFVRRIRVPLWFTLGYNDEVAPPTTGYCAYNAAQAPQKEIHPYPETGHWVYPEQEAQWKQWIEGQLSK